ncbi:hypothetical protein SDC9_03719 [bioreactor metagenome]|uniref:Uncharacterized protein n=1 Tax=bioreactor metagenome TaxID=1076179 RepID=A0A644SU09_9ZZZZ|nr:hypothetical protein [Methanobrevibacter sp.]MEA4956329.1 hypothetical protein [Methanobrevibacter sp.]
MKIVTTPMCEKILEFAGIINYKVNKNPDNEEGDIAIILSESDTKMDSLKIKLNTFTQIKNSIVQVSKLKKIPNNKLNINYSIPDDNFNSDIEELSLKNNDLFLNESDLSSKLISDIFSNYSLALDWLDNDKKRDFRKKNLNIRVKVYSLFLRDIVEDMGFTIVELEDNDSKSDYTIFPDYMNFNNKDGSNILISIPTHNNAPKDPIKRAELRYSILNNLKIK